MKRIFTAFIATMMIAAGALPALAAFSLNVPLVAGASVTLASSFRGAVAKLSWNSTDGHTAEEPATATLVSDGQHLYVRFDVTQSAPLIGLAGGDYVAIDLWPDGEGSDLHRFGVGLNGARTTDSTANTTGWEANETTRPGGYTVTMKIPVTDVPSTSAVRVQFSRWIASTGELQVWAHSSAASNLAEAGTLMVSGSVGAAALSPSQP